MRWKAFPLSKGNYRWCDYDEDIAKSSCFTGAVIVTAPEVSGDKAKMMIRVTTDKGDHNRTFNFLLKRSNGRGR